MINSNLCNTTKGNEYLFHYTKEYNILKILKEETLLVNNIDKTNDPYENKKLDFFDIKEIRNVDDQDDFTDERRFYFKNLNNMKNRIIKSISFSQGSYNEEVLNSTNRPGYLYPRMWAQYANNSQGACFVFKKKELIEEITSSLEFNFYVLNDSVEYVDVIEEAYVKQLTNLIKLRNKTIFGHGNNNKRKMIVNEIIKNYKTYYFTKDKDWEGEKEYRFLIINKLGNNKIDPELVKIDMSKVLHCIVLGENFLYRNDDDQPIYPSTEIGIIKSICMKKNIGLKVIKRDIYRSGYSLDNIWNPEQYQTEIV